MTVFETAQNRLLWQWKNFDVEQVLIYFTVSVTGTGWTEAGIEAIVIAYIDTLEAGDDVVSADLVTLLEADSTIDTVDSLEFSRLPQNVWDNNPPETVTLEIFSVEQATTSAPIINVNVEVPIYVWTTPYNSTIITAVLTYGDTLSLGDDVDYSDLDDAIEAAHGGGVATYIGVTSNYGESVQTDIVIASNEFATFAESRILVVPG